MRAWPILAAALALALPARADTVVWQEGPHRLALRDGALVAEAGGRVLSRRAAPDATLLGLAEPRGQRVLLLEAPAAEGRELLGFLLSPQGALAAGSVRLGPGEVRRSPLLAPDPAFGGAGPAVPLRVLAGRLVADAEALAAPIAEAMGAARCPGGPNPQTVEEAARTLRALPPAEAEGQARRLAACLVYAARPFEARRLIGHAFPAAESGRARLVEEELTRRIACSPHVAAIRRASPPEKTFLLGRCGASS
jgi:hypothetical protein